MPPDTKSVEGILEQLDKSAQDFTFPDLSHGYQFAIDARTHAFADAERWALIVETVGYNPRAGDVLDVVHTFGNCLTSGAPGFENDDFHGRIDNFEDVEDPDEPETVRSGVLVVRGHRVDMPVEAGEHLAAVFRRLVPAHRELLLADQSELRRRLPVDLPEVLPLDEWHQPDLFETKPSESEHYRLIAEVLASGDPGRYRPTAEPNTHWSNWPDSGSLWAEHPHVPRRMRPIASYGVSWRQ